MAMPLRVLLVLGTLLPWGLSAAMLQSIPLPCPSTVAAGTTNLLPGVDGGTALDEKLPANNPTVGIFLDATATPGTSGPVQVDLVVTSDGTNWTDAAQSALTISGTATNRVLLYEWFVMQGVKRVAVGRVVNASGGTLTNLHVRLLYAP